MQSQPTELGRIAAQAIIDNPQDLTLRRAYADLLLEDPHPQIEELGAAMHWSMDRPGLYIKIEVRDTRREKKFIPNGLWSYHSKSGEMERSGNPWAKNDESIVGPMSGFVCQLMAEWTIPHYKPDSETAVYIHNGWPERIVMERGSRVGDLVRRAPINWIGRTDKRPWAGQSQWLWVANTTQTQVTRPWHGLPWTGIEMSLLDADLCGFIRDGEPVPGIELRCLAYPTKMAAEAALSDALIRYFRTTGKVSEC